MHQVTFVPAGKKQNEQSGWISTWDNHMTIWHNVDSQHPKGLKMIISSKDLDDIMTCSYKHAKIYIKQQIDVLLSVQKRENDGSQQSKEIVSNETETKWLLPA